MKTIAALVVLLGVAAGVNAQAYKCKDASGKTQYQDLPCSAQAGMSGDSVKLNNVARDPQAARVLRSQTDAARYEEVVQDFEKERRAASRARMAQRSSRTALSFDAYTRIRSGLSTSEVLVIGGRPDSKDFQSGRCTKGQIYESWLYPADADEKNNTIVEFCGGQVFNVKRFELMP